MWYLIVPPIIIIVSIFFLLWYLSRKGSDPFIAEKVSYLDMNTHNGIFFFRIKQFIFHILEKTAYRFKVKSLQLHNVLSNTAQSFKEKSKDLQVQKTNADSASKVFVEDIEEPLSSISKDDAPASSEETLLQEKEIPSYDSSLSTEKKFAIRRRTHRTFEFEEEKKNDRPMVSEKVTRPEASYRKVVANVIHEENLIARIASNPKDFSSYEKLGDYYMAVGNIKDAKECYKQVLKLNPAARLVKIKIRRLEKIVAEKV